MYKGKFPVVEDKYRSSPKTVKYSNENKMGKPFVWMIHEID